MEFAGRKYRIKSSFRFTIFIAIVLITATLFANALLGLSDASGLSEAEFEDRYIEVTVEYGDTLWDIADVYMADGIDLRECVYILCELNSVTAGSIYPGQVLLVPVA